MASEEIIHNASTLMGSGTGAGRQSSLAPQAGDVPAVSFLSCLWFARDLYKVSQQEKISNELVASLLQAHFSEYKCTSNVILTFYVHVNSYYFSCWNISHNI